MTGRPAFELDRHSELNLLDPQLHGNFDLTPVWRRLREDEPVWWHAAREQQPGFWVVSTHADIERLYRDTAHLTSFHGNIIDTLLRGGDTAAGRMLVVTDGPRHMALRKLLSAGFGQHVLDAASVSIEAAAHRALDDAIARGVCDFAKDVAAVVPLTAVCELLGVPPGDRTMVLSLTEQVMNLEGEEDGTRLKALIARSEILLYYTRLAAERRSAPGSDIVSLLAQGEIEGRRLTDEDVLLTCYNLIVGGAETGRLSIVGGLLALIDHPAQWELLRQQPELLTTAVEEILRWTTPAIHLARTATKRFWIGDKLIESGDVVSLWNVSGNRDPKAFSEPDRFDVSRSPNRHLSLGLGKHYCIGANMGRVELRVMLTALCDKVSSAEVIGPVRWRHSSFLNGISSLPVALAGTATFHRPYQHGERGC